MVYLTFKLKQARYIRNLEETVKMEAICEVVDGVDETKNDTKIVDYECIGENKENYQISELVNIEEGNNTGIMKNSNLFEIVSQKNLTDLKNTPNFNLDDLMKIITFTMDEINNQTSNNSIFDFKIDGTINKNLTAETIEGQLQMNEFKELNSDCVFNIEEDQKANLNCILRNIKNKKYLYSKLSKYQMKIELLL